MYNYILEAVTLMLRTKWSHQSQARKISLYTRKLLIMFNKTDNNSSTVEVSDQVLHLQNIRRILWMYVPLVLLMVGLIGNGLSILVLIR